MDAVHLFEDALASHRTGRSKEALELLKRILASDPKNAPAHHLAGLILSEQGDAKRAQDHLEQAVRLWPDHPVFLLNLGIFHMRHLRVREAEQALAKSLAISPSPRACHLMGIIRLEQNSGNEAVEFFKRALQMAPEDVAARYYLGLAYQSLGQFDSAISTYEHALREVPSDFHTHLQLGKIYLKRGLVEESLKHLRHALETRPNHPEVHAPLTEAYLAHGDLEEALRAARRSVEFRPDDPKVRNQLGTVLARLGRAEEAAKEFRLAEELPKKPEVTPIEQWSMLARGAEPPDEPNP